MSYAEEILSGLTEVPCPQYPGDIIVRGKAEPVLISPLKENILIAACEVNDRGRIIAAAHSIFLDYLFENSEDEHEKRQLGNNLFKWLTKSADLQDRDQIVDIDHIDAGLLCYSHYKLITWDYKIKVNNETIKRLKLYLNDGGALFCVATPWYFLQQNPKKKLTDIQLCNFLLEFDIEFTSKCNQTPSRIELKSNQTALEDPALVESLYATSMSDFSSQSYHKEILYGLHMISVPKYPGNIALSGKSQAILTCGDCTKVIIAACKYGKGRVLVTSHSYFFDHVDTEETDRILLSQNMFKWLYPSVELENVLVVSVDKFKKKESTDKALLIRWDDHVQISSKQEELVLNFISNGGALIGVSCPWSWLHKNPGSSLVDMQLANFLHTFDIYYTSQCLTIDPVLKASDNKAEFSNFDKALEEIKRNTDHIHFEHYTNTLTFGFISFDSNVLKTKKLTDYQTCIQKKCNSFPDDYVPSDSNPIGNELVKKEIRILSKCFENAHVMAPGISEFPGSYENQPEPRLLTEVFISVETQVAEWCSTGYYLPAGVRCRITFVEEDSSDIEDWSVRVGAHTDDLSGCGHLKRWPAISVVKRLRPELVVFSAYGGLIYFEALKSGPCKLRAALNNVVEAPYYDLLVPDTVKNWRLKRNSVGLWAELAGKHIIFTVPSRSITGIEDPSGMLSFWDKVYEGSLLLSGRNKEEARRRERIVCDQQLSSGTDKRPQTHAGYPIVIHVECCSLLSDHFIFNVNILRKQGHWPLFKELGYNLATDAWAFEGAMDIFPNLSSLRVFHAVLGIKITESDWLRSYEKEMNGYFVRTCEPTYNDWARSYQAVKLYLFALLVKQFGWESFDQLLTDKSGLGLGTCFNANQDRLDAWVLKYSRIVEYNIKPHFQNFGLPVSDEVSEKLSDLEPLSLETDARLFFNEDE